MLRIIALLLLLISPLQAADSIVLAAWNVQWFPGWRPDSTPAKEAKHLDEVAETLRGINPDILILEEVKETEAVESVLRRALPDLKMHVASEFDERAQQVVICSRYPALRSGWQEWLRVAVGPSRGFAWADLEVRSNAVLHVQGHHWKSNRGVAPVNMTLRTISACQIEAFTASHLKQYPGMGAVISGDLNTSLDSEEMQGDPAIRYLIGRGWHWPFAHASPDARKTWRGSRREASIQFDHFLLRNAGRPEAEIVSTTASDHLPILLRIPVEMIGKPTPLGR